MVVRPLNVTRTTPPVSRGTSPMRDGTINNSSLRKTSNTLSTSGSMRRSNSLNNKNNNDRRDIRNSNSRRGISPNNVQTPFQKLQSNQLMKSRGNE